VVKLEFSRQVLLEVGPVNTKFHKNHSSRGRIRTYGEKSTRKSI